MCVGRQTFGRVSITSTLFISEVMSWHDSPAGHKARQKDCWCVVQHSALAKGKAGAVTTDIDGRFHLVARQHPNLRDHPHPGGQASTHTSTCTPVSSARHLHAGRA